MGGAERRREGERGFDSPESESRRFRDPASFCIPLSVFDLNPELSYPFFKTSLHCRNVSSGVVDHRVAIGDTVRVRNAVPLVTAGASAGVLVSLTRDTLVLRPLRNLETSTWLRGEGSRLSVKRGEKSFGLVKGMLIGTVLAVAGTLIYESGDDPPARGCEIVGTNSSGNPIYANCDRERREAGEVVIPLSAIVGAVAGYLIKRDRGVDVARQQP